MEACSRTRLSGRYGLAKQRQLVAASEAPDYRESLLFACTGCAPFRKESRTFCNAVGLGLTSPTLDVVKARDVSRFGAYLSHVRSDRLPLAYPGSLCASDLHQVEHVIDGPEDDHELQLVYSWLQAHPLARLLTNAVDDAIQYVLDGPRTWRFDLDSPDVDSDERATVGTKLQYRVLAALDLVKEPPLDTTILGIPVELKGTIGRNWMIPREGQCQICLLFQVDPEGDRFRSFLMRTHRVWLNAGNQDKKRTIRAAAKEEFALELLDWTTLPTNPLKLLDDRQRSEVFDPRSGQATRLTALFGFLPEVVIPRNSILTVCANKKDPMRRTRQIKTQVLAKHGLRLLCGTWVADRQEADVLGFDLSDEAWVAVRLDPADGDPRSWDEDGRF